MIITKAVIYAAGAALHRWAMRLVLGWKWRDAVVAADREQG